MSLNPISFSPYPPMHKEEDTMPSQKRPVAKQAESQPSKPKSRNSPIPNTTGKIKDDVIFAKDKSPDDLEILE